MNKVNTINNFIHAKIVCFSIVLLSVLFCNNTYAETAKVSGIYNEDLEPTCVNEGYKVIDEQGTIRLEVIPAKGHQFSDWTVDSEHGIKTHRCKICGYEETVHISSISDDAIPRLNLKGSLEGIGKKARVVVEADYQSQDQNFTCFCILTLQGHSTYGLPKKNYTLRFYDDQEGNHKHKLKFKNWRKEHKYILKANYADLSQSRNLVGGRIWADMIQTRNHVSPRIMDLPTYGTVDGFPIVVYLNDSFMGLYTLNLHKDDDLYKLEKEEQEALLICNAQTSEESLFLSPAAFVEDYSSDWEIEFCGTEDESWVKESFNQFVSFVMNSNDQEFKENLGNYLDTDAAVDYLLFIYALGLQNSGAKDLVLLNYDGRWIPSAFDMDEAFGLDEKNERYLRSSEFVPKLSEGIWNSNTGSLLWDRLLNNFTDQVFDRYRMLRNSSFSEDYMIKCVHDFIYSVPEIWYDEDFYLYPDRPVKDDEMIVQIEKYIKDRLQVLDQVFGGEEK